MATTRQTSLQTSLPQNAEIAQEHTAAQIHCQKNDEIGKPLGKKHPSGKNMTLVCFHAR
jgi:hypothetical protein